MQHNTPTAGSITWGDFTIRYLNESFAIPSGSTSNRWVWWEYNGGGANSAITSGMDIPPDLTDDDIVLFGNKNGIGIRVQASTFVDGELIVDGTILAQALSADAIDGKLITGATIQGGRVIAGDYPNGRHVIQDSAGLRLAEGATPLVDLPTDPELPAYFSGNATVEQITARNHLAISTRGVVESGAVLDLEAGTTAPSAAPTVVVDREMGTPLTIPSSFTTSTDTSDTMEIVGSAFDSAGKWWLLTMEHYSITSSRPRIRRYSKAGGTQEIEMGDGVVDGNGVTTWPFGLVATGSSSAYSDFQGLAFDANGDFWITAFSNDINKRVLVKYDLAADQNSFTKVSHYDVGLSDWYIKGLTIIGTDAYVGSITGTGVMKVQKVSLSTLTLLNTYTGPSNAYIDGSKGFLAGEFDLGAGNFRFCFNFDNFARFYSITSTTAFAEDTGINRKFPLGNNDGVGERGSGFHDYLLWCAPDNEFRQIAYNNWRLSTGDFPEFKWKKFTSIYTDNLNTQTWWTGHTWRDSVPATGNEGSSNETPLGKAISFTMTNRARLRLTTRLSLPAIPDANDPDSVSFYVGKGVTQPANTAMWLQGGTLAPGVITVDLKSITWTSANPPITNDFPASTPGFLRAQDGSAKRSDGQPKTYLDGLGAANIDGLIPPGSMMMWGGDTAPTGWLLCNGAQLNTATSPDLFAVLGYKFGGSGTTFYLPDMRSRFPVGAQPGVLKGDLGDFETGSSGSAPGASDPGRLAHRHTHTIPGQPALAEWNVANGTLGASPRGAAFTGHNHGGATGSAGVGPSLTSNFEYHGFLTLNFIIKT